LVNLTQVTFLEQRKNFGGKVTKENAAAVFPPVKLSSPPNQNPAIDSQDMKA
jgi:hypothetical protein